jgi:threonine/homoserine/homoserine lactone efflux protein
MYVISTAASQGFPAGRAAILGNATGIIGHTVLATLGLATLVAVSPTLYNIIRWLGGIYLIYLAAEVFRSPVFSPSALKQTQIVPLQRVYCRGVLMNLLNPKVALLMMALLPQFILREEGHRFRPSPRSNRQYNPFLHRFPDIARRQRSV